MMTLDRRLTADEFEQACNGRRFSEQNREIARRVLVEGQHADKVAAEFGLSRARVYAIRQQVYAAFLESCAHPSNWVRAQVVAPPDMLQAFLQKVEKKRREWLAAMK